MTKCLDCKIIIPVDFEPQMQQNLSTMDSKLLRSLCTIHGTELCKRRSKSIRCYSPVLGIMCINWLQIVTTKTTLKYPTGNLQHSYILTLLPLQWHIFWMLSDWNNTLVPSDRKSIYSQRSSPLHLHLYTTCALLRDETAFPKLRPNLFSSKIFHLSKWWKLKRTTWKSQGVCHQLYSLWISVSLLLLCSLITVIF